MTGAVPSLPIPRRLAEHAAEDGAEDLRGWVADLPAIVAALAVRWSLTLDQPYDPGGFGSWVAPVTTADGEQVVLKVGWRHEEAEDEAAGLRIWAGGGTVRLRDEHVSERTVALVLERCLPGASLREVLTEQDQDVVLCGMLRRLWREPPGGHPLRPLAEMCDMWAARFEEERTARPGEVDAALARDAMALFRELPRSSSDTAMLCTDLHAGNILAAEREPWLVIDPKPYVGDRTYDALQHLLNCTDRLLADPGALVRRLAGLLDLDEGRLRQWSFARCVHWSLDHPELADVARRLA